MCSKLASPILAFKVLTLNREEERSIEDTDRLEMQKNEEQNFVGISFVNGKVNGREKRGRKFLEKKMKWRENLPWGLGCDVFFFFFFSFILIWIFSLMFFKI